MTTRFSTQAKALVGVVVGGGGGCLWRAWRNQNNNNHFALTDDQVKFYVDNGYLIVPRLLTQTECHEISSEMDRLLQRSKVVQMDKVLSIIQPQDSSAVIKQYMSHDKIVNILKDITGAHLAHWDHGVKVFQSMLFIKPPGFPGQAYHQDELYLPTRDRSLTAIWIPLEDVSVENGCLWVVPGSHRSGIMYRLRPHSNADEFEYEEESYGFDEEKAIPVPMKAGDALFFNGYTVHKSLKNRSDRTRKVMTNHYMSANTLFPMFVQGSDGKKIYVGTADNRAVAPIAGPDPYAYNGYDTDHQNRTHLRVLENGKVVKKYTRE